MVKSSDRSAAEVKRVNQQLEERHYEFRSNCNDGDGDASACHSWGEWLAVVDKNYGDAAKMYELNCSKNGYPASCFNLGRLKLAGKGATQDDPEAFKLFEKSCADGHAAACHHVGFMRMQGIGCDKDVAKGLAAFKEACERDDANSCNRVATMFLSPGLGSPIKRDILQAKTYLEKACDANFAPACHNLAVMYKKGDESIPKDEAKYKEYRAKTEKLIEQAGGMSGIKSA
ncbi:Hcp beta-lactamase-like protein [Phytophthora cinnamomi]|uniref:Hcp beta-lactamase-like protein n=1 Tax=Phytophthora cinnamomi TaxID=4785 RepID=UPI00355AB342|nr:Hcp beta-lactamase-like protein [Phytophthora cinnamomi]